MRKQQILFACKVTNILKPAEKGKTNIRISVASITKNNVVVSTSRKCGLVQKEQYGILKAMNEYKDNVDMTFPEFLENIAKMVFEDYIKCIRSSLKAPKVFLKW